MRRSKQISGLFGIAGGLILLAGILACFWFQSDLSQMGAMPQEAVAVARQWQEAISRADLETAETLIYGQPQLAGKLSDQTITGSLIWESFLESLSCKADSVCVQTASGVTQNVTITTLDIPALWADAEERLQYLAEQAPQADAAELMMQAVRAALQEKDRTVSRKVTLNLCLRDGSWWIIWDAPLRKAMSGGLE